MQYKFKKPFKYGNETIETVELKEDLTAGDMVRVGNANGDGDKRAEMVVAATGWPLLKVSKMSAKDYISLCDIVASFLEDGETDGREM